MRGKWWATAALLASAMVCAPLALAAARTGAQPKPGSVFIGAPHGFGNDEMHWRVTSNGKAMVLVGSFAWSYGCKRPLHNYGIADPATLRQSRHGPIPMFPATTVVIRGSSFKGSSELQKSGHRFGRFTIYGSFTGVHSAKASFSFADPPKCGALTFKFTLHAQ